MSTATAPIRFRCFRCQKLLGVSKSKAGAVVSCPQCSAELIVPEPEEVTPAPVTPGFPPPTSQSSSASRIEPVVVLWDVPANSDEPSSEGDHPFPAIQIDLATGKGPERPRAAKPSVATESHQVPQPDFGSIGKVQAVETRPESVSVSAVNLEIPSIRESASVKSTIPVSVRGPRRDDVIVPRTAMILWSFVVLLALVFAFAAGLLAGRFVWARGITTGAPVVRSAWRTLPRFLSTRLHPPTIGSIKEHLPHADEPIVLHFPTIHLQEHASGRLDPRAPSAFQSVRFSVVLNDPSKVGLSLRLILTRS